jgi:hypothetical protein
MIEPVEAEIARPPIFSSQQERQMQSDVSASASTADVEKGNEVEFGPGENPKEWSKAKKW